MNHPDVMEREQLKALDFAIDLLGSASSCIGTHDNVAREMISEVILMLEQITGRTALDVRLVIEPLSKSTH